MQVCQFLTDQRVPFERLPHPPAFTARKRAKALHVPGRRLAKAVLLVGPDGYLVAVLPATHHIDLPALAQQLGGRVRLACWRELVGIFRDCEWGALTPFGPLYGLPTLLDESIDAEGELVIEGNTFEEAIRLNGRDFERLVQPRRLRFARR
jgi:Ala-tRNA(Pro) deacylase